MKQLYKCLITTEDHMRTFGKGVPTFLTETSSNTHVCVCAHPHFIKCAHAHTYVFATPVAC